MASRSRSPLTSRILALPCTVSVTMPAWLPVNDDASMPSSASAMHSNAMDFRSPAVSSMSISRPGCTDDTWFARAIRSSVSLPIALTTTMTSLPWRCVRATWSATALIRSASATDVPPYFCTRSATALEGTSADCGAIQVNR